MTRPLLGAGGLWRRGTPAVAGLGALAAAGAVAGWVWEPTFLGESISWRDLAVAAAAFSAMLLACRAITGPDAPAALPASFATGGRTEALLVTTAIGTGIVLAALQLDGILAVDEATTLEYVVGQPFAVAAGTYDDPNNHVLHTLLLWVAYQLDGLNPIVLRLPAFLSFCLLLPVLWRFVRDEYGPGAALFTTVFVSVSTHFAAYATAARGYTMQFLLFATALLCGQRLVHNPRRKRVWAAWAGALGLGGYTIPLMVFPAATTATWMALARWRRFGRDGLGSFAARTAAGLAAAAVVAGILYQVSTGVHDVWTVLSEFQNYPLLRMQPLRFAIFPEVMWHHWHMGVPAWFRGALMALVLVGVAAAGRSCKRKGTLPLALGLSTGLLILALRILPTSRLLMWMLLVLMILAGTGASLVVERAAVRAGARWPGIAIARSRRVLQWGVVALVLGAASWWASKPGIRIAHYRPSVRCSTPASWWCLGRVHNQFPPVATLAVVERLRPGDYFTSCWNDRRVALDIGTALSVDRGVGEYSIATDSEIDWSVHRVSAKEQTGTNDLFVFASTYADMPRIKCEEDAPPVPMGALVELRWPDHELVAAFENGQVYALNNWTESP